MAAHKATINGILPLALALISIEVFHSYIYVISIIAGQNFRGREGSEIFFTIFYLALYNQIFSCKYTRIVSVYNKSLVNDTG